MEQVKLFEDLLVKLEAIENMAAGSEEKSKAEDAFYDSLEGWVYELLIKYRDAKSRKNSFIDFDNCPSENEIPALVDALKKCGVRHITISSRWSSMIEKTWTFCQAGCKIEGMVKINGRGRRFEVERDKAPAFLLNVEKQ